MSFFFTKSKGGFPRDKGGVFFFTKSKGGFPRDKGGASSVEDEVISLLPNMPGGNDEDLHEEGVSKLLLCLLHHLEEITCKVPMNTQESPASLTERAGKEELLYNLCFFLLRMFLVFGLSMRRSQQKLGVCWNV